MLNTGIGESLEEARSAKGWAKAALNAFIRALEDEAFEDIPSVITFKHQRTSWRIVLYDEWPCKACGVSLSVYEVDDGSHDIVAFCHHCWELDFIECGHTRAHASRRIEKAVRDLTPGATLSMTLDGKTIPFGPRKHNPADPSPVDLADYIRMAQASYETGRQLWLAKLYWKGLDGQPQDDARAAYWFHKAASWGHREALKALAYCHSTGRGVARDDARAAELYRDSADRGDREAMYALGDLYREGRGLPEDAVAAAGWYRMAAHRGEPGAQRSYGLCLLEGKGVPKDRDEALVWLRKAATAGDEDAAAAVADLDPPEPPPPDFNGWPSPPPGLQ